MDRKATARETLRILEQGYYLYGDQMISIIEAHEKSVKESVLITPEEGAQLLEAYEEGSRTGDEKCGCTVGDISTVEAAWKLSLEGKKNIAILNFASAKNPGGGFINGAMAQEESLAASSGLYRTLTVHEEYYRNNRACPSMMYTDHAIYSPEVVFFRDGGFRLLEKPFTSSVLTLPAVNMGQVLLKGEDCDTAERVMRRRMKLALAVFAERGAKNLVLGAYGCGVFRNDPVKIAAWWEELLSGEFKGVFEQIVFAVLDRSKNKTCLNAFAYYGVLC